MDLDNLKTLWKKDEGDTLPEISLEHQQEIATPLDMIKLNMRTEFWLVVVYLVLSIINSIGLDYSPEESFYTNIISALSLGIMIYFYCRLRSFYKKFGNASMNTNYSLLNLKTELMVTKEIFLSYYVLYIPLNFMSFMVYNGFEKMDEMSYFMFILSFVICVLMILFVRKYWLYYMYGIYIDRIVNLVDELNGVETNWKTKRLTWFQRTQKYLISKLGLVGNMLNTLLWIGICWATASIVFVIIGTATLFIGSWLGWIDVDNFQSELFNHRKTFRK